MNAKSDYYCYRFEPWEITLLRKMNCLPDGLTKYRPEVTMKTRTEWREFVGRLYHALDHADPPLEGEDFGNAEDMTNWLSQTMAGGRLS